MDSNNIRRHGIVTILAAQGSNMVNLTFRKLHS